MPHAITGGRSRIGWAEGGGCAAMQAEQGGRDTKQETKNKKCATQGSKKTSISKSRKSKSQLQLAPPRASHLSPGRAAAVRRPRERVVEERKKSRGRTPSSSFCMDGPECAARADAIPKPGPLTVDAEPDAMPPGVLGLAGPALGRRRRPETLSSSWRALSPIEPFRWACRRHDHGGGRGGVPHAITGGRSRIGWAEGGGCAAMQAEQGGRDVE